MNLNSPWMTVLLLVTPALTMLTVVADIQVLRFVLVPAFMFLCPGLGVARLARLSGLGTILALSVGLSLAINTIVAEVLIYTGSWSPTLGLIIVTFITYAAFCLGHMRTDNGMNVGRPGKQLAAWYPPFRRWGVVSHPLSPLPELLDDEPQECREEA